MEHKKLQLYNALLAYTKIYQLGQQIYAHNYTHLWAYINSDYQKLETSTFDEVEHKHEGLAQSIELKDAASFVHCVESILNDIRNVLFRYQCGKSWASLKPTHDENIRFCDWCQNNVHRITTTNELIEKHAFRQCVYIPRDKINKHIHDSDPLLYDQNIPCKIYSDQDDLIGDLAF